MFIELVSAVDRDYRRAMRIASLALVLAIGCGTTDSDGDTDAGVGSGDGSAQLVNCAKVNHRVQRATDNSRTELLTYFEVVDAPPTALVERCDYFTMPPTTGTLDCPTGYTCTEAMQPLPTGQRCSFTLGEFIGGKLLVTCRAVTTRYSSQGTELSKFDNGWMTVRVHR